MAGCLCRLWGRASCFPPPLPDEICLFFTRRRPSPALATPRFWGVPGPLVPWRSPCCTRRGASVWAITPKRPWAPRPPRVCWGKLPKLPPRCCRWDPRAGRGERGRSPPAAPSPRSPAICTAFVGFFNAANVYHLPNRLDRFCFLSRGGCEPPRLPRSRLPAPSRPDLVFRAAPRRISVCKTKCFDGGRLRECLEAARSFMGCAWRAGLRRAPPRDPRPRGGRYGTTCPLLLPR